MDLENKQENTGREFVNDLVGRLAVCTSLSALILIFGMQSLNLSGTVFTLGFCYLLYKRRNWARLVISPIWFLAGCYIVNFSAQLIYENERLLFTLLGLLWFAYGIVLIHTSLTLLFSTDVKNYFKNSELES